MYHFNLGAWKRAGVNAAFGIGIEHYFKRFIVLSVKKCIFVNADSKLTHFRANLKLGRTFAISQKVDEQLTAATLVQVNAALRKHLQPASFVFGFGGDFKD